MTDILSPQRMNLTSLVLVCDQQVIAFIYSIYNGLTLEAKPEGVSIAVANYSLAELRAWLWTLVLSPPEEMHWSTG